MYQDNVGRIYDINGDEVLPEWMPFVNFKQQADKDAWATHFFLLDLTNNEMIKGHVNKSYVLCEHVGELCLHTAVHRFGRCFETFPHSDDLCKEMYPRSQHYVYPWVMYYTSSISLQSNIRN